MKKYKIPIMAFAISVLLPHAGNAQDLSETAPVNRDYLLGYSNVSHSWNMATCIQSELPAAYESYFIWKEATALFDAQKAILAAAVKNSDAESKQQADVLHGSIVNGADVVNGVVRISYTPENEVTAIANEEKKNITSAPTYHIWFKESTNEMVLVCKETRLKTSGFYTSKKQYVSPTYLKHEEVAVTAVKCYPNPATTNINVSYTLASTSPVSVVIIDITGKKVKQYDFDNEDPGAHTKTVDISALPAGGYLLTLVSDEQVSNHKITVSNR